MNVSFAGCGFIGVYHIGAASCLQTYAPFLLDNKLAGASAGAMAAAALVGGVSLTDTAREVLRVACIANQQTLGPFHPLFDLNQLLYEGLDKLLPADIHIRATGRLHVSVTRAADGQNLIVSRFNSRQHLIDALLASSFIPLLSGWLPPRLDGHLVVDGCYSDNVPVVEANTVTISPFSGNQDICPLDDSELADLLGLKLATGPTTSIAVSRENLARFRMALLPPNPEGLLQVCRQGFEDSYRYLSTRGIIQCAGCRAAKQAVGLSSTADWRRNDACQGCRQLLLDENHRSLPLDICQVFVEAVEEMRVRRVGLLAHLSALTLSPYRLSARLVGNTARLVVSGLLPSEKTIKAMLSYSPALMSCPFDSL